MTLASAFFVNPHPPESEGVDYLGLRAINLSMMDVMLPGINNVVDMIRPFTLMSWIAWRFENGAEGWPTVSTADFMRFQQKVETVFAFSHVNESDAVGLPGRQQKVPPGNVIRFQFAEFKRAGSILDAALYGPAIKSLSGLGFLASPDGKFLKVTPSGRKLALALDALLQEHLSNEQYEFISSLDAVDAPRELIDSCFYGAWSISSVSPEEQRVFADRLFQEDAIIKGDPHGRRSAVLLYASETLRQVGKPMSPSELRRAMTRLLPVGLLHRPEAVTFRQLQRHWQLLQVRQAQRLALETLFGWVERCLLQVQATDVDALVELAMQALEVSAGSLVDASYLGKQMGVLRALEGELDDLFALGAEQPEYDVFDLCDELETSVKSKEPDKEMLARAVHLLLLCVRYAEAFRADPVTKEEVGAGAAFRLPLGRWAEFVKGHEEQPLSAVLHKVFSRFIISQHLGVAASRSSDEKSRMRMSIEDRGLTSLLPHAKKALQPRRTPDRLPSALALMAECGLLQETKPKAKGQEPTYSVL